MFLSEWREFSSVACVAGKKPLLQFASWCCWNRVSPDMLLFSLYNKKRLAVQHMIRPLFPMTLLIPSYDIGKQVGLRTYQHFHVLGPLKLFKMELIHIAGVLQTVPHDGVMAHLKCLVSLEWTLILPKFSWCLKTAFTSRWSTFHCRSSFPLSLELQIFSFSQNWHNWVIAPTEYLKSYSFGKEIMNAVFST